METQVKMREQIKVTELQTNFKNAIDKIYDLCDHNDWIIKINGVAVTNDGDDTIYRVRPDFSDLSRNARKNLAKRLHNFNNKQTIKSMNILFLVFRRLEVLNVNVKVSISSKEKEINRLRGIYKIMKDKTELARLEYKKEKGNFYKEKLA